MKKLSFDNLKKNLIKMLDEMDENTLEGARRSDLAGKLKDARLQFIKFTCRHDKVTDEIQILDTLFNNVDKFIYDLVRTS